MILLSIVIPTYNRSSSLKKSLLSIKRQVDTVPDIKVEVHIIDDFSLPEQRKENKSICNNYGFQYHLNPSNHGPAHSRNIGIRLSKSEWIAFLDDDVFIDEKWLSTLKVILSEIPSNVSAIEGLTRASGNGLWDREVENLKGGKYLCCNIVYRRDILTRINGFDDFFYAAFAEDQELALRAKKWGAIQFQKELIVYHLPKVIKLSSYLLNSFWRMRALLNAEYHFYKKHRDCYHTCRYANNFWQELLFILFKHIFSTLKRRKIREIVSKPLQALILIIATLIEQVTAWFYLPFYIFRFLNDEKNYRITDLNPVLTAKLWNTDNLEKIYSLKFKPEILRSVFFHFKRIPVYNALKLLEHINIPDNREKTRIFLRIDDVFLSKQKTINQFCECIEKLDIPFLVAIPANDLKQDKFTHLIKRIINTGASIGVHGFYHHGKFGPYMSEILQLNFIQLGFIIDSIVMHTGINREFRPIAFIPPFNAITWEQILFLSKTFPVICGGPESARFTHYNFGPLVLNTGSIYFPSFYPFYGSAKNMVQPEFINSVFRLNSPVCITLHLHNEAENGFSMMKKCLLSLKPIITDWKTLPEKIRLNENFQRKKSPQNENLVNCIYTS